MLVSDFSDVTNFEQAKEIFYDWTVQIQEKPELWHRGWNIELVRRTIQLWADKYGARILNIFGKV